jgi:type IV pilus assembly protein PilE
MKKASKVRGFTLIEVMIVVAIVAILAAVAYPSYQQSITKTRRTAAQACLVEMAQFMERFYTTNLRYDETTAGVAVALANPACRTDIAAFYVLEFATDEPTQSSYALQAVPQGGQATADAGCGTLALNQAGTKIRSGSKALNQCWQ